MSNRLTYANVGTNNRNPDSYFPVTESGDRVSPTYVDWSQITLVGSSQVVQYALLPTYPLISADFGGNVIQVSTSNLRQNPDYLSSFEIEDVMVSKKERQRGESKHFSRVEDLLADLVSE
jgi:hypothetical protein